MAEFDAAQWGHTTPFDFESPPIQPLEARVELQGAGQHLSLVTTVDSHSLSQPGHIAAVHYLDPSLLVDQDMFNRLHSDSMWRDALTFSDIERPLFEQPASVSFFILSIIDFPDRAGSCFNWQRTGTRVAIWCSVGSLFNYMGFLSPFKFLRFIFFSIN